MTWAPLAGALALALVALFVAWDAVRRLTRTILLVQVDHHETVERMLALHARPSLAGRVIPAVEVPKPQDTRSQRERDRDEAHVEMRSLNLDPDNLDHRLEFAQMARRA